ncbi:hypothetical protein DLAC_03987 [Tieghemostelium lacteum]|uniref:Phosphofurin acidic cluster sorting protein 1/2 C-terminal domain-containing protein n=1 Tax=Tieghemostelium lacteum TaxID=361077 RepID=A0A151ZSD7_TIELA|nr:hypothetical protein DLAC_03987 [Tieghemostelium lacteum]|eukprot:KYQ96694.1 hypothetical protein DLAC_03987 [Tieghemostelium lacteum]
MSYSVSPSLLNRTQSIGGVEGFIMIPQLNIIGSHLKSDEKTNHHSSIKRCCHIRISRLELTSTNKDKLPTTIKFSVGINKIRRGIVTSPIDLSTSLVEVSANSDALSSVGTINTNITSISPSQLPTTTMNINQNQSTSPVSGIPLSSSSMPIEIKNNPNNPNTTNDISIMSSSTSPTSLSPIQTKKQNTHTYTNTPIDTGKKVSYFYPMDIRISFHYDHSLKEYDDYIKITLLKTVISKRTRDNQTTPISYCTINLSQILQQGEIAADIDFIPITTTSSGRDNSNINNDLHTSLNLLVVSVPKEIENIDDAQEYQLNDMALSDDEHLFIDSDSGDDDDDDDYHHQPNVKQQVIGNNSAFLPISTSNVVPQSQISSGVVSSSVPGNSGTGNSSLTIPSVNSSFTSSQLTPPVQSGTSPLVNSLVPMSSNGSLSHRLLDMIDQDHRDSKKNSSSQHKRSKLQKLSSLIKPIKHQHQNSNNDSIHTDQMDELNIEAQQLEDYYSSSSESDIYNIDNYDHNHHHREPMSDEDFEFPQQLQPPSSPRPKQLQPPQQQFVNSKNSQINTSTSSLLNSFNSTTSSNVVSGIVQPTPENSHSNSASPTQVISIQQPQQPLQPPPQPQVPIEFYLNILTDSEKPNNCILINGLRRKGKRLEQMLECCTTTGQLKSQYNCVPTRSSSDINQVLKTLLSRHQGNEAIKVVIAGSDSYCHLILKAYVSLLSSKPRGWDPFVFYLLPLGKSNDIASQISNQDQTYTSLFFSAEWKKILDQQSDPTNEQAQEIENKILQYLGLFPSTSNQRYPFRFPIGEAIINVSTTSNSTVTPFIKGIQIENESLESSELQIDYWTAPVSSHHNQSSQSSSSGNSGKKKDKDDQHHCTVKTPFQIAKITRLSIVTNTLKIDPLHPPTPTTFNLFVLYKDKLSKKKNNYLRFGYSSKSSQKSKTNLSSQNIVNSSSTSLIDRSKSSSPSILITTNTQLMSNSSNNLFINSNNNSNTSAVGLLPSISTNNSSSDTDNKKPQDNSILSSTSTTSISTTDHTNSFTSSITKFICGPQSSDSKDSNTNLFRVMIDGTEVNGVKFLTVSPQWATHVKYFTIQSFVNSPTFTNE